MKRVSIFLMVASTTLIPVHTNSQSAHNHKAHSAQSSANNLIEAGQGAFAALSEIVSTLSADPDTNWENVDIQALRDHLVDMNDLVMKTVFRSNPIDQGMRFELDKSLVENEAALRMVPAHSSVLQTEIGWTSDIGHRGE